MTILRIYLTNDKVIQLQKKNFLLSTTNKLLYIKVIIDVWWLQDRIKLINELYRISKKNIAHFQLSTNRFALFVRCPDLNVKVLLSSKFSLSHNPPDFSISSAVGLMKTFIVLTPV